MAQDRPAEQLRQDKAEAKVQATVLHDPTRNAFAAYGVLVLPSTVVVDGQGRICLAVSGYPLDYGDLMADAVRFARGEMTREQYEAAGQAATQPTSEQEQELRAHRIASLAYQLLRRGHHELAVERYRQAIELDPEYVPSHVGLARCLIRMNRRDRAREHLQVALEHDPKNISANLTMAYVEVLQGGPALTEARQRLEHVLVLSPHNAEAHYLMGRVHEARQEMDKARTAYKKAAELLLESQGS